VPITGTIEVRGPNPSGEYLVILPEGQVRLVTCWGELDRLTLEGDAAQVLGDLSTFPRQPV
jgi:hypothetical protein